jgi:HEAT repeat protein
MAALREALQDENPQVRDRASDALKYISASKLTPP